MVGLYTENNLERLNQERKDIVAHYDQGYECDNDNLPSLPAEKINRFGFASNSPERPTDEKKAYQKIHSRETKWRNMLDNWKTFKDSGKLVERTMKGIPDSMRSAAWERFLDIRSAAEPQGNLYLTIRNIAMESSPEIRQIDLDVNRTFRENVYFRERYNIRQRMLFHVLSAYSVYNTEIGYCQGMNNIAGMLLMYFADEQEAFWGISQLMTDPKWAMHGFYVSRFPKFTRFEKIFCKLLRALMPKVRKHLERLGVTTTMYLFKWFINCYIDVVPFSLTLRIWDIYLLKGENVLLAMGFTIMHVHKERILSLSTIDALLSLFGGEHLGKDFAGISDEDAIKSLKRCMDQLERHGLLPSPNSQPPPPADELPRRPFATDFVPSSEEIVKRANRSMTVIINAHPREVVKIVDAERGPDDGQQDLTDNNNGFWGDSDSLTSDFYAYGEETNVMDLPIKIENTWDPVHSSHSSSDDGYADDSNRQLAVHSRLLDRVTPGSQRNRHSPQWKGQRLSSANHFWALRRVPSDYDNISVHSVLSHRPDFSLTNMHYLHRTVSPRQNDSASPDNLLRSARRPHHFHSHHLSRIKGKLMSQLSGTPPPGSSHASITTLKYQRDHQQTTTKITERYMLAPPVSGVALPERNSKKNYEIETTEVSTMVTRPATHRATEPGDDSPDEVFL